MVRPGPNPGPKPGPKPGPISFDQSTHIAWDTGELQKQIGSKNKDKIKIVMRVWCEYRHDSPTTYLWAVKYNLKAVDKNLIGPSWHEVEKLSALSYSFTYNIGSAAPVPVSGEKKLDGAASVNSETIASGSKASAPPTFTANKYTGSRYGGIKGLELTWP